MATQPTPQPGFISQLLHAAAEDIKGLATPAAFSPYPGMDQDAKSAAASEAGQQDQSRKAAGYSLPYRATVPFAESVGLNVPGMESEAQKGHVGGVLGHAAAPLAVMGAGEALGHALPGEHPQIASEALHEHIKTGGSTVDPRTGQSLAGSRHYVVGVSPETVHATPKAPTPEQYNSFVAEHRDVLARNPNTAIGTSYDPATGLHKMELVATTTSKTAAHDMASHLGEDHAYHLGTDQKIPTGAAGEWQPSPLAVEDRLKELQARTPQQETYSGTHFSDAKIDMIDGSRRGMSGTSAEAKRLRLGSQTGMGDDAPAGFHTYRSGALPDAPMAAKKSAYQVRGRMAFASTEHPSFQQGYAEGVSRASQAGADPQTAHQLGLNAAERAVQDAGFDGYFSPKHPDVRFHFGSEPAVPAGPKAAPEIDWNKPYGPKKADFHAEVPQENMGFDFTPAKDYGNAARADVERRMGGPLPRGQAERRGGAPGGVTPNGSGESAASMEAINRVASEKKGGVKRVRIDTRSGNEMPLIGTDAVDAQAGPYDVIVQRTPQGDVELDRGIRARAFSVK
jgi:hypothetical protein